MAEPVIFSVSSASSDSPEVHPYLQGFKGLLAKCVSATEKIVDIPSYPFRAELILGVFIGYNGLGSNASP